MIPFVILSAWGLLEGDSGGRLGVFAAHPPFVQGVVGNVVWSPSLRPACVSLLGIRHARRAPRIGLLSGARSDDDDVFGEDFPRYNNVPDHDVSASDGAPQITDKKGPSGALGGAFGGVARRSPPALSEDDMTEGLKERVYHVMLDAFDNYPPQEVSRMLDLLWAAGPDAGPTQNSVRQLVQLTAEVEAIAKASRDRSAIPGSQFDDLLDSLQVARSRVRMNAKDADMYDPQTTMGMLKRLSDDAQAGNGAWDASALWGFGGARGSDGKSKQAQEQTLRNPRPPFFGNDTQTSGGAGERGSEESTPAGRGAWWWPFQ